MSDSQTHKLRTGGAVPLGVVYVERSADMELFQTVAASEFCYVLAPRQIGKTSLRVRVQDRLAGLGVKCAAVDLSTMGTTEVTIDQWYLGLLDAIALQLGLPHDPLGFWRQYRHLSAVQRFVRYFQELVAGYESKVAIFIDEIETTVGLPFSRDDFFGAIRGLYNLRADDPRLKNLTFCLLGVAAPGDLMHDSLRTPFNIGRAIFLGDFTSTEAEAFLPVLDAAGDGRVLLNEILAWTDGHPYMTARLCDALLEEPNEVGSPKELVARNAETIFLRRGRVEDMNLQYAEKYIRAQPARTHFETLQLYRRLLHGDVLLLDRENIIQNVLRLSGLAADRHDKRDETILRVRNRIFSTVFDEGWVREQETNRKLAEPVAAWISASRNPDYLLQGAQLDDANLWAQGRDDVTPIERDFLVASLHRRAQQSRNRAFTLIGVSLAFMVVLAGLALVSFYNERLAQAKAIAVGAARVALLAGQPGREFEALALAIENVGDANGNVPPEAIAALSRASSSARTNIRFEGHTDRFSAFALSKSGEFLASASEDGTALLQNAVSGAVVARMKPPARLPIAAMAVSPDAKHMVIAPIAGPPEIWSTTEGTFVRLLFSSNLPARSVFYSASGVTIVALAMDGTVSIHDARDGQIVARLPIGNVVALEVSEHSNDIVAASGTGEIGVFNSENGSRIAALDSAAAEVLALAISDDGALVAADVRLAGTEAVSLSKPTNTDDIAPQSRHLLIFDQIEGSDSRKKEIPLTRAGASPIIKFSPDGSKLVTLERNQAKIWSTETGTLIQELTGAAGFMLSASWSNRSDNVVTVDSDGVARLWSAASGELLRTVGGLESAVEHATFSREDSRILAGTAAGTIWRIELTHDDSLARIAHAGSPTMGFSMTSNPELVLTWTSTDLSLNSVVTGAEVARYTYSATTSHNPLDNDEFRPDESDPDRSWLPHLSDKKPMVLDSCFLPDANEVVVATNDGLVVLALDGLVPKGAKREMPLISSIECGRGRKVAVSTGTVGLNIVDLGQDPVSTRQVRQRHLVVGARWSNNGRMLAATSIEGVAQIWNAETAQPLRELEHSRGVLSAQFSPDDKSVVTTTEDGDVTLWNVLTGEKKYELALAGPAVRMADFSRDGGSLVVPALDGRAFIWKPGSMPAAELKGHTDWVLAAAFSPNGAMAATGDAEGKIKLWDATTTTELATWLGHSGIVYSLQFTADNKYLVSLGRDNVVRIFPASLSILMKVACGQIASHLEFNNSGIATTCSVYGSLL